MSFSFGFTNEDFVDDELNEQDVIQNDGLKNKSSGNSADTDTSLQEKLIKPVIHSLQSILDTLIGVRITFNAYSTPGGNILYRRDLYDIKHQVMMEDQEDNDEIRKMLLEENGEASDLKKNVYEGGFKSWECSYDTVDELSRDPKKFQNYTTILELGSGVSAPTCYLLTKRIESKRSTPVKFILTDYNYEVLRLISVPNLLVHWASTLDPLTLHDLMNSKSVLSDGLEIDAPNLGNDELQVTERLANEFLSYLAQHNIDMDFISGSWGNDFTSLMKNENIDFIISSETIYSLETLPLVAITVRDLLKNSNCHSKSALIAAKNFYFGVGGSVPDFLNYIRKMENFPYKIHVKEINDQNLKRSIINIEGS